EEIFQVLIGEKVVLRFGVPARAMKPFFVEEERYLVWIEVHSHQLEMICILRVEQKVPRITRATFLEHAVAVRRATKDIGRTDAMEQHLIDQRRVRVRGTGPVKRGWQLIAVVRDIEFQADSDLMEIVHATGCARRFLSPIER